MKPFFQRQRTRRSLRRGVQTPCHVVTREDFRLIGLRTLDLSTRGLLVRCQNHVELGEPLLLSVQSPTGEWIDAEAEVARVIYGRRDYDQGPSAGLRFTHLAPTARDELLVGLAGIPPVIPHRAARRDYAATVKYISLS